MASRHASISRSPKARASATSSSTLPKAFPGSPGPWDAVTVNFSMAVLEAVASAAVGDGHQGADVLLADQVAVDEGVPRVFDPSELRRDEEAVKPGMAEGELFEVLGTALRRPPLPVAKVLEPSVGLWSTARGSV